MDKFLESISLKDITYFIVGAITVISIVAEKVEKFPFKPFSLILKWLGKGLNRSVNERLDKMEEKQESNYKSNKDAIKELKDSMDKRFSDKQKDDDEKEAKRLRASIIEFADSCRVGNHHTQNHFENVMRDYSDYVEYCNRHKIPNHFIDNEYYYIESVYQECLRENKFL